MAEGVPKRSHQGGLDFKGLNVHTRPRLSEVCVLGFRLVGLLCSVAFAVLRGH